MDNAELLTSDAHELRYRLPVRVTVEQSGSLLGTLRDAARSEPPLVLDCEQTVTVDCAGLQLLAQLARSARRAGSAVQLIHPSARLLEDVELLGLAGLLELE